MLQLTSESMNITFFLNPSRADTEANHCSGILSITVIVLHISAYTSQFFQNPE